MALLRQCLQAVRTKHHDWDATDAAWPVPMPIEFLDVAAARALPLPSRSGDIHVQPEAVVATPRAVQAAVAC